MCVHVVVGITSIVNVYESCAVVCVSIVVYVTMRVVGWTPLHCAALHQHADVIRLLIQAGADTTAAVTL